MTTQELQQLIISNIYENTSGDISGSALQNILLQISNKLSDGLYFGGVVGSESVFTPDTNSFYVCADAGTYQSFGDIVVQESSMSQCLRYDNTLEHWIVEELPIPTFDFTNIANSSLYGGVVTPNEEPIYGNDHRYFYLAFQEGRYTNFNNYYVDSNVCLFYWREGLSNWAMLALWPNTEFLDELFSSKAYKPSSSTNGHLAGLTSEGDLTDSGIAADDVVIQDDISGFITNTVNDLTNYYLKSETYTKAEVAALIEAIQQFHYEIYQTLPQTGQSNVLYLIGPTGSGVDKYEEYVYFNNAFTKIGDTSIDLSGYITTSALNTALADYTTTANLTTMLAGKQDTISDLATIRSGAALGATAYQKPQTGIPESDLSSDVQQALQKHFKGWWPDLATLKAAHTATEGDSAYVKDASPATTWSIYVYDSTAGSNNYWADSGTDADTSHVQTFASGEEVNEVHIVQNLDIGGENNIPSSESIKDFKENLLGIDSEYEGDELIGSAIITTGASGTYAPWKMNPSAASDGNVLTYTSIGIFGTTYIKNDVLAEIKARGVKRLRVIASTGAYKDTYVFFAKGTPTNANHTFDDLVASNIICDGVTQSTMFIKVTQGTTADIEIPLDATRCYFAKLTEDSSYDKIPSSVKPLEISHTNGIIDDIAVEVVDNCDTDNATKALSARQGKELKQQLLNDGKSYVKYNENIFLPNPPMTANFAKAVQELYLFDIAFSDNVAKIDCAKSSGYFYIFARTEDNTEVYYARIPTSNPENDVIYNLLVSNQIHTSLQNGTVIGKVILNATVFNEMSPVGNYGNSTNIQAIRSLVCNPKINLSVSALSDGSVTTDKLANGSVTTDKFSEDVIQRSNNLFNKDKVTQNAYIVYTNGTVKTNQSNWWCSDFILLKPNTTYSINHIRDFAFYNINKQYVSGETKPKVNYTFTTGANVYYLRFSCHSEYTPDVYMLNEGSSVLPYEPYSEKFNPNLIPPQQIADGSVTTNKLADGSVGLIKVSDDLIENFYTVSNDNLLNRDTVINDKYIGWSSGNEVSGFNWWCSDFIACSEGDVFYMITKNGSILPFRDGAWYDANKQYISGWSTTVSSLTAPANACYFRFSQHNVSSEVCVTKGSRATGYKPYHRDYKYLELPKANKIEISLPDKIFAVVGDTLQLFYRGMIQAKYPYQYDILPVCSVGKMLSRYFEFTPTSSGTYNFTLSVKDDNNNLLGQKSCQIVVVNPSQPINTLNVACFGDSLTSSGAWCKEAYRRLTGVNGTPTGLQFTGINFVGKKSVDGVGYFGEGGWTWNDFTTQGRKAFRFFVASTVNVSRGAVYTDGTDNYTIAEVNLTADNPNILGNAPYGTQHTPSGNTLTKVSGSGDNTITFTSYDNASQNPLWNYDESKVDFQMYADAYCNGQIDVVYTLLSWNGQTAWRTDFTSVINQIKIFADALHRDFPNAKLKIMGVQLPDIHGGQGQVEGSTGVAYADQYGILVTALNQNKAYQDFANSTEVSGTSGDAYNTFVEFVNVSSQFDVEYNMPTTTKPVNTRCSTTELIGTNDVHPNTDGYMQIADVAFRNFVCSFCN